MLSSKFDKVLLKYFSQAGFEFPGDIPARLLRQLVRGIRSAARRTFSLRFAGTGRSLSLSPGGEILSLE
jgi:hypothetical protein